MTERVDQQSRLSQRVEQKMWNSAEDIARHRAMTPQERWRKTISLSRAALRLARAERVDERSIRGDSMNPSADSDAQQALLEQLIVAVSRLARPAEGQVAYLRTLDSGRLADELALEFDDVQGAVAFTPVGRPARAVQALDEQLSTMSQRTMLSSGLTTHL